MYTRFLYTLILVTYYNNICDILGIPINLDIVSEVLEEISLSITAVCSICEAANDAFNGFFMAALISDPAWKLGLRKLDFFFIFE